MNFSYSEDQLAIADVAQRIFSDMATDARVKTCFQQPQPFDRELWEQLAGSGLLAAPLPEAVGGSAMGLTELGLVLEAQGRHVAPVPILETVVECALPLAEFAGTALQQRILPGVVSGELVLAAVRPYQGLQDRQPLVASRLGEEWQLDGDSALVSYAPVANGFLISATTDKGEPWLGYCDAQTAGLQVVEQKNTSGEPAGIVRCNSVRVNEENLVAVGDAAAAAQEWQLQRTCTALAALQLGILREGLQRAADYTRERHQFGRPLATFQAVAQQAADGYMAVEALRGVYWRALDDIDHGRDAGLSARVAKFWVCEAGHTAAHIYLHLHGGIGQDLDYPLHRFFTFAKRNEHYVGGSRRYAAELGRLITQEHVDC